MNNALVVFPWGGYVYSEVPKDFDLQWACDLIGCDLVEIVRPERFAKGIVMLVDEEGMLKDSPKLNPFGCWAYETEVNGGLIVGTVIVMGEKFGSDGPTLCGLSKKVLNEVRDSCIKAINVYHWEDEFKAKLTLMGILK